jgi:hypothetical protein
MPLSDAAPGRARIETIPLRRSGRQPLSVGFPTTRLPEPRSQSFGHAWRADGRRRSRVSRKCQSPGYLTRATRTRGGVGLRVCSGRISRHRGCPRSWPAGARSRPRGAFLRSTARPDPVGSRDFRRSPSDQPGGAGLVRPTSEKVERRRETPEVKGMSHGPFLGLDVVEIRQVL